MQNKGSGKKSRLSQKAEKSNKADKADRTNQHGKYPESATRPGDFHNKLYRFSLTPSNSLYHLAIGHSWQLKRPCFNCTGRLHSHNTKLQLSEFVLSFSPPPQSMPSKPQPSPPPPHPSPSSPSPPYPPPFARQSISQNCHSAPSPPPPSDSH